MTLLALDAWGPCAWRFLHAISFAYAPDSPRVRLRMYELLRALPYVLPCKQCAKHYEEYTNATLKGPDSAVLRSQDSLSRWVCELHNNVNARTGKQTWDYEEVRALYLPPERACAASSQRTTDAVCARPWSLALQYLALSIVVAAVSAWAGGRLFCCRRIGRC